MPAIGCELRADREAGARDGGERLEALSTDHGDGVRGTVGHPHLAPVRRQVDALGPAAGLDVGDHGAGLHVDHGHVAAADVRHEDAARALGEGQHVADVLARGPGFEHLPRHDVDQENRLLLLGGHHDAPAVGQVRDAVRPVVAQLDRPGGLLRGQIDDRQRVPGRLLPVVAHDRRGSIRRDRHLVRPVADRDLRDLPTGRRVEQRRRGLGLVEHHHRSGQLQIELGARLRRRAGQCREKQCRHHHVRPPSDRLPGTRSQSAPPAGAVARNRDRRRSQP